MSKNALTLKIDLQDYSAGLTGFLSVDGYCGHGEGWFNTSEIEAFISELSDVVNNVEGGCELIGGDSQVDGSNFLERFGLRCYPIGKLGVFGIHVTLAERPYTECRDVELLKISGELKSETQQILNFLLEFKELIAGKRNSAYLEGV